MVPDNYQLPNLTRVAQKGLDLYIKRDGKWQFAGVGMPGGVTTERVIVDNMGTEEKECLLYLPLYDELKSLEIGVSSDAHIRKGENPFKEKDSGLRIQHFAGGICQPSGYGLSGPFIP